MLCNSYIQFLSIFQLLVIRLSRTGRRNQPKYRLVVAEHTAPIKGKVVEILGHYEPTASDKKLVFDKEKVETYIKNGAKPSNTVAKILNANGFDLPVHVRPERKPRKEVEVKPEVKPVAPVAEGEETPVAKEGAVETPAEDATEAVADAPAEETKPTAEAPVDEAKVETSVEEAKEDPKSDSLDDSESTEETPEEKNE